MSNFSTAFSRVLDRADTSQTALAASTGIAIGQINRYARGRSDIRPSILTKLLVSFPENDQATLVRAYLLDQISKEHAGLIEINTRGGSLAEPEPDVLDGLPDEVKQALRFIGSRCTERPVLDLVLDLKRILKGEK
jgi:transcriptional regulator with XRE-family HTH domain